MLDYIRIPLWPRNYKCQGECVPEEIDLTRYARHDGIPRPAMLVVPGGGYGSVCRNTEGDPVAERFSALGFQVFLLNYRIAPHRFPEPQQDILRAIKLIRANAQEWGVLKDNVAVVGFSAGGHLCASSGIFYNEVDANAGDAADAESPRPDATILAYPVITFVDKCHWGSLANLVGEDKAAENKVKYSLELQVRQDTPPAFLFHTIGDNAVPYVNSILYAEALNRRGIPCELHLYPNGYHGSQLGYGNDEYSHWPEQSKRFLENACHFRFPKAYPGKTIILTFDDACKSQMENAVPILLEKGFGATFFITRFSDEWREQHQDKLMSIEDIQKLHSLGFDIGNHTWSHAELNTIDRQQTFEELSKLNRYLLGAGIPTPVSFAYPCGIMTELAQAFLRCHDFRIGRLAEDRTWNPESDNPYLVPAFAVHGEDKSRFYNAVAQAKPDKPAVLIFHGIPDTVHPWVNTPLELFREYMDYLKDNGFNVCSFRQYIGK